MPEIVADPPSPRCCPLLPGAGIEPSQLVGPDLFARLARTARAGASPSEAETTRGGIPKSGKTAASFAVTARCFFAVISVLPSSKNEGFCAEGRCLRCSSLWLYQR